MKKETQKSLLDFFKGLGVLILYLAGSLFAEIFLIMFGIDYDTMPMIFKVIYNLSYEILLVCTIIFIYKDIITKDFKKFIKNNQKYFKEYIKYWFLALGLMIISNMFISFIANAGEKITTTKIKTPIVAIISAFHLLVRTNDFFPLSFSVLFLSALSCINKPHLL